MQPVLQTPLHSNVDFVSYDEAVFERLAIFNKAVAEPLRLDILRALRNSSYGVLELSHILDVKQSALSHHLKILSQAGWLATRREGNSIFYRRQAVQQSDDLQAVQQALLTVVDKQTMSEDMAQRIRHIQTERAASSAHFFRQHADYFQKQQELIATHDLYAGGVRELLNNTPLLQHAVALEVGPGNGGFLPVLSDKFQCVIALDNSTAMLQQAQSFSEQRQLNNIEFIHSDTATAVQNKMQADCVVMNMVLHHTPAPAAILFDLADIVRDKGLLLITELCSHDQDWVKEACGDLWLGFDSEELTTWAKAAGFIAQQSVYHALRNGFQIQMHAFIKEAVV